MRCCHKAMGTKSSIAVEFALLAPLLITLALALIQIAAAIRVQLEVNRAAWAVADLISQQTDVTTAELTDYAIAANDCYDFGVGNFTFSAESINFLNAGSSYSIAWDANSVVPSSYVLTPTAATTTATATGTRSGSTVFNLSDGLGNDSVIVVTASSTIGVPFPVMSVLMASFHLSNSYTFSTTVFARSRTGYITSLN